MGEKSSRTSESVDGRIEEDSPRLMVGLGVLCVVVYIRYCYNIGITLENGFHGDGGQSNRDRDPP